MWYGILIGIIGSLSGTALALWYRSVENQKDATIVGLTKDNASLLKDRERAEDALAKFGTEAKQRADDDAARISTLNQIIATQKTQLGEVTDELNKYLADDPSVVAEHLGRLFPTPPKTDSSDK